MEIRQSATTRETLHRLIDVLPEQGLASAKQAIEQLVDPFRLTLANASGDDEPKSEDERAAVAQAFEDVAHGRVRTWEAVRNEVRSREDVDPNLTARVTTNEPPGRTDSIERGQLHSLVASLPDTQLAEAKRYLTGLNTLDNPALRTALLAPIDDEPLTDEEIAAVGEAERELARGEYVTLDDVRRELGLA